MFANAGGVVGVIVGVLVLITMVSVWTLNAHVAAIRRLLESHIRTTNGTASNETWECPKCKNKNPNGTFKCEKCGYQVV